MNDDLTQFTMRMTNSVYEKLKSRAERHKRSIAKEIEFIIEETLKIDDDYKKRAISFYNVLKEKNLSQKELQEYKFFVNKFAPQFLEYINLD